MDIYQKIKNELSIIENMYDQIRIVDPINKTTVSLGCRSDLVISDTCFDYWKKHASCKNCISMRAYNAKDTFVKIEYRGNKVVMVTSAPIFIDENMFVVEMLKDISRNGRIFEVDLTDEGDVDRIIQAVNDKIVRDERSGAYNRRYIDERLPIEVNHNLLHGSPLSVIMLHINNMKDINRAYGQLAWNQVVRDLVIRVRGSIRKDSDWIARYSEDELFIVLNHANGEKAANVVEKIKAMLNSNNIASEGKNIPLDLSFGIICTEEDKLDAVNIMTEVHKRLHQAKRLRKEEISINDHTRISGGKVLALKEKIEEIREILNEMCLASEDGKGMQERLILSQYLDELIVEYMNKAQGRA